MKRRIMYSQKVDKHTLMLLHCDNNIIDKSGNYSFSSETTQIYVDAKFGKGLQFSSISKKIVSDKKLAIQTLEDWTIDFWAKAITISGSFDSLVFDTRSSYKGFVFGFGNNYVYFSISDGVTGYNAINRNIPTATLRLWNHYGIVKIGNRVYLYMNGKQIATQTYSSQYLAFGDKIHIGGYHNNIATYEIEIDEFRVSNIARWNSDFTPPTKPY